jgi:hypothetical protein
MAEIEKSKVNDEVSENISETSENKKEEIKPKKSKAADKKPEPPKPYVHIDTFLQTAVPMYGLNSMQAQGFKARMNGRHYQTDEQVFLKELKAYLNLK